MPKTKCIPSSSEAHSTKCVMDKNMFKRYRISVAEANADCSLESNET